MRDDEEAQVHILEMLTLFWLFFMSATFLIRVNVPDARSVAIDASLETAGEDALMASMALPAELTGESLLHEYLSLDLFDEACTLLQEMVPVGKETNCWLAQNAMPATPYGEVGTPNGATVTVHQLLVVDADVWTISLDVWSRGGVS
ncbi:MAG: hypothetical protein ISR25_02855 [Candidatus Poseidoniaceae archaeon]|nr:hypothetical protein [Candidatus Poseidoniaceae archaeon]